MSVQYHDYTEIKKKKLFHIILITIKMRFYKGIALKILNVKISYNFLPILLQ